MKILEGFFNSVKEKENYGLSKLGEMYLYSWQLCVCVCVLGGGGMLKLLLFSYSFGPLGLKCLNERKNSNVFSACVFIYIYMSAFCFWCQQ